MESRLMLAASPFMPVTYEARQATSPITIDGNLNDPAWVTADTVSNFYLFSSGGQPASEPTTTKILWDDNFVYVGMTLSDRDINSANVGHDGAIYNGDNAELFLKPTLGDTPYYEWEFSPNGDTFDALFPTRFAANPPPTLYESGVVKAITLNGTDGNNADIDTGWTLEMKIPRASMTSFAPGDNWTFLSARYDYPAMGDPVLMLSSPGDTPSGFHTYEVFNNLKFVAAPGAVPFAIGGDASVDPSQFRLTTFATLNHPYGMQQLPDGSLLVGVSTGAYFSDPGQLIRLTDLNNDGVADDAGTVLADNLPPRLTSIRQAGNLVFADGPDGVTILRKGATEASPYTAVGTLTMAFPQSWEHTTYAIEVRPTPGQPGKTDLFFNIGSAANDTGTPANQTVALSGLISGTLQGDSIYLVTMQDTGGSVVVSNLTQIASGQRNAAGMAFDPATGDLYFEDNGIDGLGPDGDEPVNADELNVIRAADIGGAVENYGFSFDYIAYRGGRVGSGGVQPLAAFQPLPDPRFPSLGSESEGPAEIALAPANFPAALNNGVFLGMFGKYAAGVDNEENAVVFYNRATGNYFHFIDNSQPGVGHLTGLLSTQDSLFLADQTPTNNFGPGGGGAIYQIKSLVIPPANQPPTANNDTATTSAATPVTVSVLANDTDPDGTLNASTVALASNPASGMAVVNADGSIGYTPAAGFAGDAIFSYTVNDNAGATSNAAQVTVTVLPPTVALTGAVVVEGDSGASEAVFMVNLSAAAGVPVTVRYSTVDGTAVAGEDYVAAGGTLTFAPGQTSLPVAVSVLGDTTLEPDEAFALQLGPPTNATLVQTLAQGTILNDDAGSPPTISKFKAPYNAKGGKTLKFTVIYRDDQFVNRATIDSNDVVVIGPDGTQYPVTLFFTTAKVKQRTVQAQYKLTLPNVTGTFTLAVQGGQVADMQGAFMPQTTLGQVKVKAQPQHGAAVTDEAERGAFAGGYSFMRLWADDTERGAFAGVFSFMRLWADDAS